MHASFHRYNTSALEADCRKDGDGETADYIVNMAGSLDYSLIPGKHDAAIECHRQDWLYIRFYAPLPALPAVTLSTASEIARNYAFCGCAPRTECPHYYAYKWALDQTVRALTPRGK
jgi:hypothetical protein